MRRAFQPQRLRVGALLLVLGGGLSCGEGGGPSGPPEAGILTVSLATTRGDDGAYVLLVEGPALPPEAVVAADERYLVHARQAEAGAVRVLVVGDMASGPLLRLEVPDVAAAREYRVTLVDAADRTNRVVMGPSRGFTVDR